MPFDATARSSADEAIEYLKALRDPFPGIPFIAVGGVGLGEAADYWEAGAIAVGLGGPLFGSAASGGDLAEMRERAHGFLHLAADFAARTGTAS